MGTLLFFVLLWVIFDDGGDTLMFGMIILAFIAFAWPLIWPMFCLYILAEGMEILSGTFPKPRRRKRW